jgi:ribosomal protein S12 methylthiotransferase
MSSCTPVVASQVLGLRRDVKVGMISLGCAKNLVDAEIMLGDIRRRGMEITNSAADADVLIVNTCAFIDSAKTESIDAILEAHRQRGLRKRKHQKLLVSGCMSQRFATELSSALPEVDAFLGLDQVSEAGSIVERVLSRKKEEKPLNLVTAKSRFIPDFDTPRFRLTPSHYAYVKIAEGCNHPCSFCVIPQMRGRHRSRSIESLETEIRHLVAEGVKEFNLISQDTTYFGMDRWAEKASPRQPVDPTRGQSLVHLLACLEEVPGDFWLRLLYTHPAHWSPELIRAIAANRKVARYIDMPLQHIHDDMLQLMRRETSRRHIEDLISAIREGIAGVTLRTTFIVGFPGETDEHFRALLEFIERVRFERLGVFMYSQEEGSRAAKMPNQVSNEVKRARYQEAMELQQRIARQHSDEKLHTKLKVLVEQPLVARTESDAPEVDTRVLLENPGPVGEFATVRITGSQIYDLRGEITE